MEGRSFVFLLFIIIFFFSSFPFLHQPENGLHEAVKWDWPLERGIVEQKVVGYRLWQGVFFFSLAWGAS